jgi:PPK2 family polyphosphate:nucleotide phosphotransferase
MAKKDHSAIDLKKYLIKPGEKVNLKEHRTDDKHKFLDKADGERLIQESIDQLSLLQDKLYASNKYSILIVLQAMDAAGKDSTIRHLMSGLNPAGVDVCSFKVPSHAELAHDYFWRHYRDLPARGKVGIFNRSHYENVLVTKVHPELILSEQLPGINSVKDIDKQFWEHRYRQIRNFERTLAENGTIILKFFLHVSKEEQKKRFLERIDDPKKNWKFSVDDLKERAHWDDYQEAYEEAIGNTSEKHAPWYIIPADDKWYMRLLIGKIVYQEFERLKLAYPEVSKEAKAELLKARDVLLNER